MPDIVGPALLAPMERCGLRQEHRERRSGSTAGAGGANRSAMQFNELLAECQTQTQPAMLSRKASVSLTEQVEHARQERRRNAHPAIADDGLQLPGILTDQLIAPLQV